MKILIEVDITEAALNALAIIDQANQTDAPLRQAIDLDDRFSKNIREQLESAGLLDWEYDDFVQDCLYTVSTMGYRTLSAAIQSGILKGEVTSPGEQYLQMESQHDIDLKKDIKRLTQFEDSRLDI